jgi:hypothetical protein
LCRGLTNIKSGLHPKKIFLSAPKNYINNNISASLVLNTLQENISDLDIFYKIDLFPTKENVLKWTKVQIVSINEPLFYANIEKLPLTHNQIYEFSLKGVRENDLESDIYSWVSETDFTQPFFLNDKIEVSQIVQAGVRKHILFLGKATEDVSAISHLEIFARTGIEPKWEQINTVSADLQRVEVANLKDNRTYFYKAIALNTAGAMSAPITSNVGISTTFSSDKLTGLSNYPNPFNSNLTDTTIYYFLNQDMNITIKIFNIFGKIIWENNFFAGQDGGRAGANEVKWQGIDLSGNKVPMGSYPMLIYELDANKLLNQRIIGVIH